MPTIDKITASDKATIKKLTDGGYVASHGLVATQALTVSPKFACIGVLAKFNQGLYTAKTVSKTAITVHQTVGTMASDLLALTSQKNMTTNYLIARDGTVLEIFPPQYYAYHLGKNCVGGNGFMSQRTISIEISTYGPLDLVYSDSGNLFNTVYGSAYGTGDEKMLPDGTVSSVGTDSGIVKLQNAYRGYKYFAAMTGAQYTALRGLLDYLQTFFRIPNAWIEYENRFSVFADDTMAKEFKGCFSHVNVRPEGKWDIGPAAKWELITGESKPVDFVPQNDEGALGMDVIAEQKYNKLDDFEYEDTKDPITGATIELAEDKKKRIIRENNPLICAW